MGEGADHRHRGRDDGDGRGHARAADRRHPRAPRLTSTGAFLLFGIVARRGAAAGFGADPVPQALVITGIVVAFAATALAAAVLLRLARVAGTTALDRDAGAEGSSDGVDATGAR
ncbi:MAG: NADH-quinone oxidoreductase subunit K [Burkholderiaceae bacterium]|nr:NADH-quinone oxidoreductase subunit K [Burkholderiaceae bacterium]